MCARINLEGSHSGLVQLPTKQPCRKIPRVRIPLPPPLAVYYNRMIDKAFTDITVELSSPNFEITKNFYKKLGFSVVWEESPQDMNGYLVMRLQQSILCFFCGNEFVFQHPYFKSFPKETKRGYGVEISIPIVNIDKYYQKVITALPKTSIFQELKEQPWGKKDFRIEDPDGYFLRFNEPWNVLEYLPLKEDYTS